MIDHLNHEALLSVRDFLMRAALYQANEFGRVEVRKEARTLLKALDEYLHDELDPQHGARIADTPDLETVPQPERPLPPAAQGERPVNQGERAPNFQQYFPKNGRQLKR